MIKLYRFLYLLAAVYFQNLKCNRMVIGRMEFTGDAIMFDSDFDHHCYTIFYGTTFMNVKRWQREEKLNDQSILLLQCRLVDCAELPRNMFSIGCKFIDTSTDELWSSNGRKAKTVVEAVELS